MLHLIVESALLLLALCGLGYYLISLWSAYRFLRSSVPEREQATLPPVSILKPLKGADREIYSSFRSHCLQNYPQYEIIFGVNSEEDDAVPLVRRLMAEFPDRDIRLVLCSQPLGMNRKVSNLSHMLRHAKYSHVIVNDSDIKVSPEYLRRVMAQFDNPEVGLVTCPYRGVPARSLGSWLESLGIATDFIPGVLTAQYVESGIHFGLGSTLAMSRQALQAIGGFEAVIDYLADDFELGSRISAAGYTVVLVREVVETFLPRYTLAKFFEHQMRWARSTRDSRPSGYLGLALTFGLAWAMLATMVAPHSWWSWSLLGLTLIARLSLAATVGWGLLRDRAALRHLWLIPIRDLIALCVWIWSYAGDTVTWRGEKFLLRKGRMLPLKTEPPTVAGGDSQNYRNVGPIEPGSSESF